MGPPGVAVFPISEGNAPTAGGVAPQLAVLDGPWKGEVFALSDEPFTIGRRPGNRLVSADPSISRHHCTIDREGGQFRIRDHDSQNGTFVNAIPVRERSLSHGDRIAVGQSLFVLLTEPPVAINPLAKAAEKPARPATPMVGESPAMARVREHIVQLAPLNSAVLIFGERGAGKKLAARVLHESSPRVGKPFGVVNCAAFSEVGLESELFGHERAAFPGAVARKHGCVELTEGGTILLDDVVALSPALQGKLLRLLDDGQFERLGGIRRLAADVRIVATGHGIAGAVESGGFRRDLYFRLSEFAFQVPPLARRREDVPLLANFFRCEQSLRYKRRVSGITAAARDCLLRYNWPGNVRELQSAIAHAVAIGSAGGILPEDLPEAVLPGVDAPENLLPRYHRAILETRRELILKAYQQARGSSAQAAALLGLHPSSLQRLVRSLGLTAALESLADASKSRS